MSDMNGTRGIRPAPTQSVSTVDVLFEFGRDTVRFLGEVEQGPPSGTGLSNARVVVTEPRVQEQRQAHDSGILSGIGNDISRLGQWIARKLGLGGQSAPVQTATAQAAGSSVAETEAASNQPPSKVDRALRQVQDWLSFQGKNINDGTLFVHKFGPKTIAREALTQALDDCAGDALAKLVEEAAFSERKANLNTGDSEVVRRKAAATAIKEGLVRLLKDDKRPELRRLLVGIADSVGKSAAPGKAPEAVFNALVHAGLRPLLDAMISEGRPEHRASLRTVREALGSITADEALNKAIQDLPRQDSAASGPARARPPESVDSMGSGSTSTSSSTSSSRVMTDSPPRESMFATSGPSMDHKHIASGGGAYRQETKSGSHTIDAADFSGESDSDTVDERAPVGVWDSKSTRTDDSKSPASTRMSVQSQPTQLSAGHQKVLVDLQNYLDRTPAASGTAGAGTFRGTNVVEIKALKNVINAECRQAFGELVADVMSGTLRDIKSSWHRGRLFGAVEREELMRANLLRELHKKPLTQRLPESTKQLLSAVADKLSDWDTDANRKKSTVQYGMASLLMLTGLSVVASESAIGKSDPIEQDLAHQLGNMTKFLSSPHAQYKPGANLREQTAAPTAKGQALIQSLERARGQILSDLSAIA